VNKEPIALQGKQARLKKVK